jgi:hypothetical protein
MTGGIDSCVCGTLLLDIRPKTPIFFVSMGFKPETEKLFEEWATKNFTGSKFKFLYPQHPQFDDFFTKGIDSRQALIGTYINLLSSSRNLLSIGLTTKSEYSLIREIGPDLFDCYPLIDLYRSEIIALGENLDVPKVLLESPSMTESKMNITYAELEWIDRENNMVNIIGAKEVPTVSRFWGLYTTRQKEIIAKIYRYSKQKKEIELAEKKMCLIRKSLPGSVS